MEGNFEDSSILDKENYKNRKYLYGMQDITNMLSALKSKLLKHFDPIVDPGDYFAPNQEGIFIFNVQSIKSLDPKHDNDNTFQSENLIHDIHKAKEKYSFWSTHENPVQLNLFIIPILYGGHWVYIVIEPNYQLSNFNINWDNPFGSFNQDLKAKIFNEIKKAFKNFFPGKEVTDKDFLHSENKIDQQGKGKNGWDCGPIIIQNIVDYINHFKNDQRIDKVQFTIKTPELKHIAQVRLNQIMGLWRIQPNELQDDNIVKQIEADWQISQKEEPIAEKTITTSRATQFPEPTKIIEHDDQIEPAGFIKRMIFKLRDIFAFLLLPLYTVLNAMFYSNTAQVSPDNKANNQKQDLIEPPVIKDPNIPDYKKRAGGRLLYEHKPKDAKKKPERRASI